MSRALADLAQPAILAVLFVPMTLALASWGLLAWFFWADWLTGIDALLVSTAAGQWLAGHVPAWVVHGTGALLIVVLLVPAVLLTSAILTEIIATPVILRTVAANRFPGLAREGSTSPVPGLTNLAGAIVKFLLLWIVTLPLWFTGLGTVVVPLLNAAYLTQCVFSHDALAEHARPDEIRALRARHGGDLFLLGVLMGAMLYVPILNLIAPVVAGLAYTHYCLDRLAALRGADAFSAQAGEQLF